MVWGESPVYFLLSKRKEFFINLWITIAKVKREVDTAASQPKNKISNYVDTKGLENYLSQQREYSPKTKIQYNNTNSKLFKHQKAITLCNQHDVNIQQNQSELRSINCHQDHHNHRSWSSKITSDAVSINSIRRRHHELSRHKKLQRKIQTVAAPKLLCSILNQQQPPLHHWKSSASPGDSLYNICSYEHLGVHTVRIGAVL